MGILTNIEAMNFADGSLQSTASYPSLPELLINPCGDIQQRSARDGLGILKDRWIQAAGITNTAWTATGEFENCWQFNASGNTLEQRIESITMRRGWTDSKQIIISAHLEVTSAGNLEIRGFTPNAKDNYATWTQTHTVSVSVSTGLQRLIRVITLPDEAYQRGFQATIASTGALFKTTGISVKPGAIWTPFVQPDIVIDQSRCRRFYKKETHSMRYNATGASQQGSQGFNHVPEMRITPAVSYGAGPGYQANLATGEQVTTGTARSYRYEISSTQAGDIFIIAREVYFDAEIR